MNNSKKAERLGEENMNYQNCLMKIIEYIDVDNIIIEFLDEHKAKVYTKYNHFKNGIVKNPYKPSVHGVGIVGNKYPTYRKGKQTKEYVVWKSMIGRCFDKKIKQENPTYQSAICCKEWLLYESFYEWLHSQPNFNKWLNGDRWALDKDILIKGNKIYSPETCCLVPMNINELFTKCDKARGDLPIGVNKHGNKFRVSFTISHNRITLPVKNTINEAFMDYKEYKESYIKQVAQEEYDKGNITKQCYDAMINYEVEITD